MGLEITLHTAPEVPLEAEKLSPACLLGSNPAEIERLPVLHGNRKVPVGEFFRVSGSAEGDIVLRGDLRRVKLLGTGMSGGRLRVEGSVGAHLGAGMSGGEIIVEGDAGDWVGPELSGGRITVKGNAGHMVGSAFRGNAIGVTGGEIIVHGRAGNEVGSGMRRGFIAIGGDAGDFTGVNMRAGTVAVLGRLGMRSGAGMVRGTIVTLQPAELLPTFAYACTYEPTFLKLYLRRLQALGLAVPDAALGGRYQRWSGDAIELNRGEILIFDA